MHKSLGTSLKKLRYDVDGIEGAHIDRYDVGLETMCTVASPNNGEADLILHSPIHTFLDMLNYLRLDDCCRTMQAFWWWSSEPPPSAISCGPPTHSCR